MDKSVIKFSHCDKDIFCFFVPEECPECGTSFSGRRLEEAPISIPNPFTNGHKTPCAFLIAPAEENALRYSTDLNSQSVFFYFAHLWKMSNVKLFCREYDGGSDLHTGITNTNGKSWFAITSKPNMKYRSLMKKKKLLQLTKSLWNYNYKMKRWRTFDSTFDHSVALCVLPQSEINL